MDRLFDLNNSTGTVELLREMALYLAEFQPAPTNLYVQLIQIIKNARRRVIFVTTNYDLMIEYAASICGLLHAYQIPPLPRNNISLLKIHGSCNFLPKLGAIKNVRFDLGSAARKLSIAECHARFARSRHEIEQFLSETDMPPMMAMYAPGKRFMVKGPLIAAQMEGWQSSVAKASAAYVIGLSVQDHDEHIWGPLAATRSPLYYVGPEQEKFFEWRDRTNRRHAYGFARTFAEAVPKIRRQLQRQAK